ncbi:MAG: MBL fold metallo-hydrolase [Pseudohongiellaceae bacterium]|nr:MBL fold metallo-hydrolase [Gammaproteobacteria bacterium]HIL63286.1 MBL fold metallo-hydrolase [Porticoccaceae bacterium]
MGDTSLADTVYYQDLGHGISCIDTMLQRRGLAACYLLEHGGMAGFIDTGTNNSVPILCEVLRRKGIAPTAVAYIMPTHVHLDHAGGAGGLMQQFPNATLIIHPRGARHMIAPAKLEAGSLAVYGEEEFGKLFGRLTAVDAGRIQIAEDGFELDFNGRRLVFLDTPGHARHHYVVYDELSRGLFTGDTFGASYPELNCGRSRFIFPPTTPIQFDPLAWQSSLDRLMTLDPQRVFVTHFGMHEDVPAMKTLLRQSIQDHADTAEDLAQEPDRCDRIAQSLLQASIDYLLDAQCGIDVDTIRALIGRDMELNAQGLDHWLSTLQAHSVGP